MDAREVAAALRGASSGPPTLVVAPNWVGDLVMALPALVSLAAERPLTLLAKPHLEPVVAAGLGPAAGFVARARSDRETVRRIRDLAPEEAVVLPNSFRSAWLPWRAGVPIRWGYRGDLRRALLEPAVPAPTGKGLHQLRDYDRLLRAMGLEPDRDALPRLTPGETAVERARAALTAAPGAGAVPRVALFAGGAFGPSKRWPAARFAEAARRLAEDGRAVVLVAGPGEEELAAAIAGESAVDPPVVGADLDLAELAALLAELDLLVTNDSGPMHLAAAVGTRCVALFGPTDPRRTAPLGKGHRVLWTHRWCSPCFRKRCPLLHHRCLREIGAREVLAACREILQGTGNPRVRP